MFVIFVAIAVIALLLAKGTLAAVQLKPGVKLNGLQPQMAVVITVGQEIFGALGKEFVITSANDSSHAENSLHYQGLALDIRSHDLNETQKDVVLTQFKQKLGTRFTVLLEDRNGANEHYHIQWKAA